jgi:shikimate kinase
MGQLSSNRKHIYLLGYRGSGKSTVGRLLALRLGYPVIDTDTMIETTSGLSIREIFAQEGEAGFRDREERVLADVAHLPTPSVVALGGGAILREANQLQILQSGRTIWLQGSPQELFARIQADMDTAERRPNLSARGGYDEVVEVLAAREPLYRRLAEKTVATDGRSPDGIVAEIVDWLN